MKPFFTSCSVLFSLLLLAGSVNAQQNWPKTFNTPSGDLIKIYQPQAESFQNNILQSRSAVSVVESGKTDPVFGMFWSTANLSQADDNNYRVSSIQITNIKFPSAISQEQSDEIKSTLQSEMAGTGINISKDEIQNALSSNQAQQKLSNTFNNTPPKVIYSNQPATLVLIDGTPKMQMNNDWGVETVINTPFTIVKNIDNRFYLYGGKRWYTGPAATGPFSYITSVPDNLQKVQSAVDNADNNNNKNDENNSFDNNTIPQIIVSTEPAELIQTNGEANFSPIENTGLLYVKNSSNDIFMDVNSQQYYVLLSGRWYKSGSLKSQWQFIGSDKLPSDFSKIPAGSPKDNVLASVAGTDEANNALLEAQVPQTAKVDRRTATASVTYDGDPEFERINGTRLQYAVNASATVLKLGGVYYTVDNGVWFESGSPAGPWIVSTTRPGDVDLIPPSYPVYNVKYVYIYDYTPDYVYMGYTPGYLNTYIYGPTIVYGTGYYYRPWYRHYYYARPYTWGFCMNYDPWYGWGFGFNYNFGWFNIGFGRPWGYSYGGWWGPALYRPAYCGSYYRSYGYYGNRYPYRNSVNININYNNNIYRNRPNVYSTDNRRWLASNNYYNNRNGYNNSRGYNGNNNAYNNRGNDRNRNTYNNNNGFNDRRNNGSFNNNNRMNNDRRNGFPNGNYNNDNNFNRNRDNGNNNLNRDQNRNRTYTPDRNYNPPADRRNNNQGFDRQNRPSRSFENNNRSSAPAPRFERSNSGGGGGRSDGNSNRGGGGRENSGRRRN